MSTSNAGGWLKPSDAAKVSGMTGETLRDLALAGRIPEWALLEVGRNGGRFRYSRIWCEGDARKPSERRAEAKCA